MLRLKPRTKRMIYKMYKFIGGFMQKLIVKSYHWGVLEEIHLDSNGLLRIKGWTENNLESVMNHFKVFVDTKEIEISGYYNYYRPDVAMHLASNKNYSGFVIEFIIEEKPSSTQRVKVYLENELVAEIEEQITKPDYSFLLHSDSIHHREHIYGFGPPVDHISKEVLMLVKPLQDSVLDFGCGRGNTVSILRQNGIDAYGLEIEREAITSSIREDVKSFITLYDGQLPAPYEDNSFENLICIEVLEHIPYYEVAVKEFYRIARNQVIITVPNIGAIPMLHKHHVIPWHLLESTHVNFFTEQSLKRLLNKYFSKVEICKIGQIKINQTEIFYNIAAICQK